MSRFIPRWIAAASFLILFGFHGMDAHSAQLRVVTEDAVGRKFPVEAELLNNKGEPVTSRPSPDGTRALPAGTYLLSLDGQDDTRITIAENDRREIAVKGGTNSLWLDFREKKDGPVEHVLVHLRPAAERRHAAQLHRVDPGYGIRPGIPRPSASPADIAAALSEARASISSVTNDGAADDFVGPFLFQHAFLQILCTYGDASDARRLASLVTTTRSFWIVAPTLAAMESRLGKQADGELRKMLKSPDPVIRLTTAKLLAYHGDFSGRSLLLAELLRKITKEDWETFGAAGAMLADTGSDTRRAMREVISRYQRPDWSDPSWGFAATASIPASAWLLAHGDVDDWRAVTQLEFGAGHVTALLPYITEPAKLTRFFVRSRGNLDIVPHLAFAMDLPEEQIEALMDGIEEQTHERGVALGGSIRDINSAILNFQLTCLPLRPNQALAREFYRGNYRFKPAYGDNWIGIYAPWIRDRADVPVAVNAIFAEKKPRFLWLLDRIGPSELATVLRDPPGTNQLGVAMLRRWLAVGEEQPDPRGGLPAQRIGIHPFFFQNLTSSPNDQGTIVGSALITPALNRGRLTLTVEMRIAAHYNTGGFIDFNQGKKENWPHHKYVVDHGRALVNSMELRRGGKPMTLSPVRQDEAGRLVYEAEWPHADFSETEARLQLKFLDQTRTCIEQLHYSNLAYLQRLAANPRVP